MWRCGWREGVVGEGGGGGGGAWPPAAVGVFGGGETCAAGFGEKSEEWSE